MRKLSTKSSGDNSPSPYASNSPTRSAGIGKTASTLSGLPPASIQLNKELNTIPFAPTFRPTVEEFNQPYVFIDKIRPHAQKYGICKIIPPEGWRPPCPLDFNKVRFGTKKQRIDQLMDRGNGQSRPSPSSRSTPNSDCDVINRGRGRPRGSGKDKVSVPALRTDRSPPEIQDVDINDAELFYSALGSWLEYEGHTTPGARSVPLQDTDAMIDLHALYTVVTSCGGINSISDTIGWQDLLSNLGVNVSTNKQGIQKPLKSLWNDWLASFDRRRTAKPSSVPTRKARQTSDNAGDDGVIELDDDGDSHAHSSRKRKSESLGTTDEEPRRSKRDRRPPAALINQLAYDNNHPASNAPTAINGPCVACKQSDHHNQKLSCAECSEIFHSFCISPPLQSLPSHVRAWLCRDCANEGQGTWGFGTGNVHTLASYREQANAFKRRWFNVDDSSKVDPALVASEFWRIVQSADHSNPVSVEYGSDLDTQDTGSVYPTTGEYATHPWNLNVLPRLPASVLTALDDDIEGVSIPWLYVGMCFSAFCWHNEDHYSFSVNYVSVGEPKQWYGISSDDVSDFETSMTAHLPSLFRSSPDLLSHLTTMLAPTTLISPTVEHAPKVRVHQILQNAGEIVLTFPQAYHAGFNVGWNCSESVNFGPISFLPFGQRCLTRYRYFHRTPVWSTDEIVWKVATSLVQTFKERRAKAKNKYNQTEQIAADRQDSLNGELPIWKRAAYVLPSLVHLCDREYSERFRLVSRGTMRMKPWPDPKQAEWFQIGQRVQANIHGVWRDGTIVGVLDDGTYQVKQQTDGLVKLVDQRCVRAVASQEEVRTHAWDTIQNLGVDSSPVDCEDMDEAEDEPLAAKIPRRTGKMMTGLAPIQSQSTTTVNPRCLICQHFLYLSCVHCSCTLDKAACLSHSNELCGCASQSKYAVFRYTLSEISELCDAVADIIQASPKSRGQFQQPLSYHSEHPIHAGTINGIMIDSHKTLASLDSHVMETHVRITSSTPAQSKSAQDACTKALRHHNQFPLAAQSSPLIDIDHWRTEADDWLARYESISDVDMKDGRAASVKSSEIDGILNHAQQFMWGDYKSFRINQAYRRLQSYQRSINFLSLQLCSIVSAHGLFKTMASQLVQYSQSFEKFTDSKLLTDFVKVQPLAGCMPLSHAQDLQSSLTEKTSALTCHCNKISSRYQRMNEINGVLIPIAGPFTNPSVFTPPTTMQQHLTLFNDLLKDAETLAAEKTLFSSHVVETPAAFSPQMALAFQHGINPIICPQRQSVMNRVRAKLLDVLETHSVAIVQHPQIQTRRSLGQTSSPAQQSPLKNEWPSSVSSKSLNSSMTSSTRASSRSTSNSPVDLSVSPTPIDNSSSVSQSSSSRIKSSITNLPSPILRDRELAESISHVHIKQEVPANGPLSCAMLPIAPARSTLDDDASTRLPKQLVDWCADSNQASELMRFSQAAIRCLNYKTGETTKDAMLTAYISSPVATLSMLVDLSRLLTPQNAPKHVKLLMSDGFTAALTERLKSMHCWFVHAQRLMSWVLAPAPLTNVESIQCACLPMIVAANKGEMPSLSFCRGNHALPRQGRGRSNARIDRYGICCIDALLSCPVVQHIPSVELDMVRHSRAQVNEWSTRVTDLLLNDHSIQQRTTPMSYVHGLKAEGEQLPFVSPSFNAFMDAFNRMLEFQLRLDAANRQASDAIQKHSRFVMRQLVRPDAQATNDRVDGSRWLKLEQQLLQLQSEGMKLRVHLHEMVALKRLLKQIKSNRQDDKMEEEQKM